MSSPQDFPTDRQHTHAILNLAIARNLGAIATVLFLGTGALLTPSAIANPADSHVSNAITQAVSDTDALGPLRLDSVKNLKSEAEAAETAETEAVTETPEAAAIDADASDANASDANASETETTDTTETLEVEDSTVPAAEELPLDPDLTPDLSDTPAIPAPIDTTPVDTAPVAPEPPAPTPVQRKVETRIQINLSDRSLTVYSDGNPSATYPVAVGKEGWETPVGDFSVTHMALNPTWENPWTGQIIEPGPSNPMGSAVIVFHTVGDDMIALHGTNNEELIGQAVSHGCVRMRNADIENMYNLVRYGTAVSVVP